MITADLYLDKIDFLKYLPGTDCKECGNSSCAAFVKQLKSESQSPSSCPFLNENQQRCFQLALRAESILPEVPALDLPRPTSSGLMEVNRATKNGLILVSGNSQFTQEVLSSMMAFTLSPFWLLFVDCCGDTVDMAMIYGSLEPEKIIATLKESRPYQGGERCEMVLPGFASKLKKPLEQQTGWQIRVGPICVAELPLFLGDNWEVPPGFDME